MHPDNTALQRAGVFKVFMPCKRFPLVSRNNQKQMYFMWLLCDRLTDLLNKMNAAESKLESTSGL